MTINDAKEQVKYAVESYLAKDENGTYIIPVSGQRPVFVMGPPGIGKTEIMKQVAEELNIGLVSYSMTHHTRQSALGLPIIVKKQYNGQEYEVSEYTMSEILSTVYDVVEDCGITNGILFLDEINCVSETLAPSMLQFLQFKTFGRHKVPDGWVVVTAGNPPEYNESVREFDVATWDRLKRVDVEPDYEAWTIYAQKEGVHPAILTYLTMHEEYFYKVESTAQGKQFVTARGWVDLSRMIPLYEEKGFLVNTMLIGQYVQNDEIAKDFSRYYRMYRQWFRQWSIEDILAGNYTVETTDATHEIGLHQQRVLTAMLQDRLNKITAAYLKRVDHTMAFLKDALLHCNIKTTDELDDIIEDIQQDQSQRKELLRDYEAMTAHYLSSGDPVDIRGYVAKEFERQKEIQLEQSKLIREQIANAIRFSLDAINEKPLGWIDFRPLVSVLSGDTPVTRFMAHYPVKEYQEYLEKAENQQNTRTFKDRLEELDIQFKSGDDRENDWKTDWGENDPDDPFYGIDIKKFRY